MCERSFVRRIAPWTTAAAAFVLLRVWPSTLGMAAERTGSPLEQTPWHLAKVGSPMADAKGSVTLSFKNGNVTGSTGCNRVFGGYSTVGEDGLKMQQLGLTRMACVDEQMMRQEQTVVDALRQTDHFAIRNGYLELRKGDKVVAIFEGSGAQNSYRVKPLSDEIGPTGNR